MSLICIEVFLWLAHQNLDYPENSASDCGIIAEYGVDRSVNTSAAHVCETVQKRSVTLTHFFVAQTVTISVVTAGDFSLDLGFSCFIWGSGVFIENLWFVWLWSNFRNACCITVFSIQEYSSFIAESVQLSKARLNQIVENLMFYRLSTD